MWLMYGSEEGIPFSLPSMGFRDRSLMPLRLIGQNASGWRLIEGRVACFRLLHSHALRSSRRVRSH